MGGKYNVYTLVKELDYLLQHYTFYISLAFILYREKNLNIFSIYNIEKMESLGDLTMNQIIELAKVAKHQRKKNTEACLRYYYAHHDEMKEKRRISAKKYYDLKKAKQQETIII
jgi:hypothetical protein